MPSFKKSDKKSKLNDKRYGFLEYVSLNRFLSYYNQLYYIKEINPKSILEVGSGNNFLKNNLEKDFIFKTLDIKKSVGADYTASVENMPLKDESFDLVCCFQVLEHLPFEKFEKSIKELHRVSKKYVLLSLPYSKIDFKMHIIIPFLGQIRYHYSFPRFYKKHRFNPYHFWEIGEKGYPKTKINEILQKYFIIDEIKNPYENTYHIFFKLRKK